MVDRCYILRKHFEVGNDGGKTLLLSKSTQFLFHFWRNRTLPIDTGKRSIIGVEEAMVPTRTVNVSGNKSEYLTIFCLNNQSPSFIGVKLLCWVYCTHFKDPKFEIQNKIGCNKSSTSFYRLFEVGGVSLCGANKSSPSF